MKKWFACAAIAATVVAVGSVDAKKPVNPGNGNGNGVLVPGINLVGEDFRFKAKNKQGVTTLNNFSFTVANVGDTDASNSRIEFWLSDGDAATTPIHTQSLGKIKAGSFKKRTVGGGLLKQVDAASGQYIVAVIDSTGLVLETNEFDNVTTSPALP